MFTSSVPPLHYEVLYDFIQPNWNNNYLAVTDGYEQLVQAGPQPVNVWVVSSHWDVEEVVEEDDEEDVEDLPF